LPERWIFTGTEAKGTALKLTGRYLTVRKKDAVGAWKAQSDMGTTDPAPPK
jgi:ketosteroid isomerase-like protein